MDFSFTKPDESLQTCSPGVVAAMLLKNIFLSKISSPEVHIEQETCEYLLGLMQSKSNPFTVIQLLLFPSYLSPVNL